jgi:DNA helicase-2/ATP-dependent DNA helicase PcrA
MTLARMKVPYRITSGVGVFEQIHVKDVLAYLRLLLNPRDELSFLRLVTLFPGVGEKTARTYWEKLGRQFDASRREDRDALHGLLAAKAKPLWPALAKGFACAGDHLDEDETGEVIDDFCDFFYEDHLRREWEDADANDRLEDIKELAVQIAGDGAFSGEGAPTDGRERLERFLADVALMTNLDARRNASELDRVTLSTIHQAKGMEWPVVIVPWLSEGMFPSSRAADEGRLDEERRLFYVVVTRAKDRLHLFVPQVRRTSDGGMFPVNPSTFVKEIPNELVTVRRIQSYPDAYAGGFGRAGGGYGSGGFGRAGGGYGAQSPFRRSGGSGSPPPVLKKTWRR